MALATDNNDDTTNDAYCKLLISVNTDPNGQKKLRHDPADGYEIADCLRLTEAAQQTATDELARLDADDYDPGPLFVMTFDAIDDTDPTVEWFDDEDAPANNNEDDGYDDPIEYDDTDADPLVELGEDMTVEVATHGHTREYAVINRQSDDETGRDFMLQLNPDGNEAMYYALFSRHKDGVVKLNKVGGGTAPVTEIVVVEGGERHD